MKPKPEPLQAIEEMPDLVALAERLGLDQTQTAELAAAFHASGGAVIKSIADELIETLESGVIELAQRHKDDELTLAIIRRMQAAIYGVYTRTR